MTVNTNLPASTRHANNPASPLAYAAAKKATRTSSAGHEILDPDAPAFDTCRYCGEPIILRDGHLVTMLTDNSECYGARS